MGLSICQSIVMAHGGSIRAESNRGQGTKLIVSLPMPPDQSSATGGASSAGYASEAVTAKTVAPRGVGGAVDS